MMTDRGPTRPDIETAAARVAPHVRLTPVLELGPGCMGGDWVPLLKLELMQHSGSFKARGAFNNLLSRPVGAGGVTAVTGGNHGAAVAYAAGKLGIRARIFVPCYAPAAKIALIRSLGAEVEVSTGDFPAAVAACDAFVATTGALQVHPFSDPATIAGQGTLFAEWQRQTPLDTVVIAVGGGGADRRGGTVVRGPGGQGGGGGTRRGNGTAQCAGGGWPGRCGEPHDCRGFAGGTEHRAAGLWRLCRPHRRCNAGQ